MFTDNALPAERLKAFLLIARGMANFTSEIDLKTCMELDQKCGTLWHARFPPLLGGGLEPHFRVLFSAIFQGFPWGVSIRVEICGSERKQKCSFFVVKLLTKFSCVLAIVCLPQ